MASIELYTPGLERAIKPFTYASVFLKRNWTDPWQWIPFLEVDDIEERTAPGVSQARFTFDFGRIKRAPVGFWASYEALFANGAFCLVWGHNRFANEALWVGIIEIDEVDLRHVYLEGVASGGLFGGAPQYVGVPQGRQQLTAYGIEHLLDRWAITGSYTEAGWLDRPMAFNRRERWGERLAGNRSEEPDANGIYYFSSAGYLWTNLDIAQYLLWHYGPIAPVVLLDGQWGALNYLVQEWDFEGMTPWQAMNELIDRRRGLGWRIVPSTTGPAWAWVFSQLPEPLAVSVPDADDVVLPANEFQSAVDFSFANDTEASIQLSDLERYDLVDVIGGPLSVCCTLSLADGTLEPGWTAQQETDYKAGSTAQEPTAIGHDWARAADKWHAVYQKFRVPNAWDWTAGDGSGTAVMRIANPVVALDGTVLPEATAPAWIYGKTFRRELPFESDEEGERELRQPFVVLQYDGNWAFAEKAEDIVANVRLSDNEMAVYVEPRPINHIAAENHWTGAEPTEHDPLYDYETYMLTVMFATDQHLRVRLGIHPAEAARIKRIEMPYAEAWYVLHGTVLDLIDGEPARWGEEITPEPGYMVRNDVGRLRAAAVLASVWYAVERRTLTYRYQGISTAHFPGSLIRAAANGLATAQINTVVTERQWNFGEQTTTVRTGFEDLDAEALVNNG